MSAAIQVKLTADNWSWRDLQRLQWAVRTWDVYSEDQPGTCAFLLGLGKTDALFNISITQLQDSHTVNTGSHSHSKAHSQHLRQTTSITVVTMTTAALYYVIFHLRLIKHIKTNNKKQTLWTGSLTWWNWTYCGLLSHSNTVGCNQLSEKLNLH